MPSADATPSGSATRAAHVLHRRPADASALAELLTPALERLDASADALQLLVLTVDAETALLAADAALQAKPGRPVVPVTSVKRAVRLLAQPRQALAGSVADVAELLRRSALRLDGVRTVVLVAADDIAALEQVTDLDAILAEIPKDAARIATATAATPGVDDIVTRHLPKARTMDAPAAASLPLETLSYVAAAPGARGTMLRRLLDELDPPSVAIVAADAAQARETLARLGYGESDGITVGTAAAVPEHAVLVILWDLPSARALATVAAKAPVRVIAFVAPREVPALRAAVAGPALVPFVPKDVARSLRAAEARLRADLRAELGAGAPLRELLALEPLFDEYDPAEVAAAAVRLLDRAKAAAVQAAIAATLAGAGPAPTPRAEPTGERAPRSDDRGERPPRAPRSEDRGDRPRGPAKGDRKGGFGARGSDRGERPARGGFGGKREDRPARGSFGGSREDRPARGGFGGSREDRPARGGFGGRDERPRGFGPKGFAKPRPARGAEEGGDRREWQERGERLQRARRPKRGE